MNIKAEEMPPKTSARLSVPGWAGSVAVGNTTTSVTAGLRFPGTGRGAGGPGSQAAMAVN